MTICSPVLLPGLSDCSVVGLMVVDCSVILILLTDNFLFGVFVPFFALPDSLSQSSNGISWFLSTFLEQQTCGLVNARWVSSYLLSYDDIWRFVLVWLFYRMLVPVFSWKFQGLCSIVSIVDYIITFWDKPGIGCLLTEVVCWCLGEGASSWWPCRRPPVPFSPLWSSTGPQSSSPQLPLSGVWWHNSLLCTWNLLWVGFSFLSWKPFFGHRDVGCLWPRVAFPSFDARARPGSLSAAPLWSLHVSTSQSPSPLVP